MRKLGSGIIGRVGALAIAIAAVTGCGDNGVVPEDAPPPIDAPEIDAPQLPTISDVPDQTIDEDGTTGSLGFTVADPMGGTANLTVTASSNNTTVIPDANVVLGGSGGNRTVTVTPAANQFGSSTITLTVTAGTLTASSSFTVTVSSVNDLPTITAIADQTVAEGTATNALAFTIGDVETAVGSLTVTGSSSNTALIPNGNVVIGGTGANRTVTVTPTATGTGSSTITVSVGDGTDTVTETFVVTVSITTGTNDPPVNTVPGAQSTNEDVPLTFGPGNLISIADVDAGTSPVRVTLATTIGTLSLANTGGLTFTTGDGTADASLDFTGTIGNINNALNGMTLQHGANLFGTGVLTITTNDQGNSGTGGAQTDTDTVNIAIVAVNDVPTITNIGTQTINEDTSTGPLAFTVGDVETAATGLTVTATSNNQMVVPDANLALAGTGASRAVTVTPTANAFGSATITLTVSDPDGGSTTTTFTVNVTGVNDAPTIDPIPDQSMNLNDATDPLTVTINVNDLETAAGSLVVTATSSNMGVSGMPVLGGSGSARTITFDAQSNGTANITVTVSDGMLMATDVFILTVNDINDAPTISGPNTILFHSIVAQGGGGTGRTLSFTGTNLVSIADVDAGTDNMDVSITCTNGQVRVPNNVTGVGGEDDNNFQTTVDINGAQGALNNALAGLQYRANQNFFGASTCTITTDDNGNNGTGGTQTATKTITVNVNARPTITGVATSSVAEDGTFTVTVTVADDDGLTSAITTTGSSSRTALAPNPVITGGGAARLVTVTPAANQNNTRAGGNTVITLTATDALGGDVTTSFQLNVTQVNDNVVNSVPAGQAGSEDVPLVLSVANGNQLSFSDIDAPENTAALYTVTLAATNSVLINVGTVGVSVGNQGTSAVTIQGTATNVINALNGTTLTPPLDSVIVTGTLTMTTNDGGNAGGGATIDTDNIAFSFSAVNDAPVHANVSTLATQNANTTRTGLNVDVSDVDSGTGNLTVTITSADANGAVAGPVGTLTLTAGTIAALTFTTGDGTADPTMVFSGTAAQVDAALNAFSFLPNAGYTGDARITITTNDNGNTGSGGAKQAVSSIQTTFSALNTPPTVSDVTDKTTAEDMATTPIAFTVNDAETNPNNLNVTVTSSNPQVTVEPIGGSGMARTVVLTPAANFNGSSTITISVSDGGAPVTDTFVLNVTAVNDAPVIDGIQVSYTGDEDNALSISFNATDVDNTLTPGSMLAFTNNNTLFPLATTPTTLTTSVLVLTPAANLSGMATVTLSATDGLLTTTKVFNVTINPVNDSPTLSPTGQITVADLEQTSVDFFAVMQTAGETFSLGTTNGLTFFDCTGSPAVDGDGLNDTIMCFSGTITAVNAALDDLETTGGTLLFQASDQTGTATQLSAIGSRGPGAFGPN